MIKLSFPLTIKPLHMLIGCLASGLLGYLLEPLIFSKKETNHTESTNSVPATPTSYCIASEAMPSVITPRETQASAVDLAYIQVEQLPNTITLLDGSSVFQYAQQKYTDLPKGASLKPLFILNEAIVCQDQTQDSVLILSIEKTDLLSKIDIKKTLKSSLRPTL
jgi:hypothetical protein